MRLIYACLLDYIRQSANRTEQIVACKRTFNWKSFIQFTLIKLSFFKKFFYHELLTSNSTRLIYNNQVSKVIFGLCEKNFLQYLITLDANTMNTLY